MQVGEFVVVHKHFAVKSGTVGRIATIDPHDTYWLGIDFGEEFRGHTLAGRLKTTTGYFVQKKYCELAKNHIVQKFIEENL